MAPVSYFVITFFISLYWIILSTTALAVKRIFLHSFFFLLNRTIVRVTAYQFEFEENQKLYCQITFRRMLKSRYSCVLALQLAELRFARCLYFGIWTRFERPTKIQVTVDWKTNDWSADWKEKRLLSLFKRNENKSGTSYLTLTVFTQ